MTVTCFVLAIGVIALREKTWLQNENFFKISLVFQMNYEFQCRKKNPYENCPEKRTQNFKSAEFGWKLYLPPYDAMHDSGLLVNLNDENFFGV